MQDQTSAGTPDQAAPAPTPAGTDPGTAPAVAPSAPDKTTAQTAPDDASALDQATWPVPAYGPVILGSGAIKMHMSEVAPVVAAAHGNRSVNASNIKEAAKDYPLDVSGSRHLTRSVGNGDAMLMPWYRLDDVYTAGGKRAAGAEVEAPVTSLQWRPSTPLPAADGKVAKYVIAKGHPSVMGVHPSTPKSWFDGTWPVMICEGSIKGDAALTGLLLDAGVSSTELELTPAEQAMVPTAAMAAARTRLRLLMEAVPAEKRVLVVTLIGVGNWHQSPEWNAIRLAGGRNVMVAFDGDVATNVNVHRQASALQRMIENKQGTFSLVQIPSVPGADKPGIDDYLATAAGRWSVLVSTTTPNLPAVPSAANEARVGDWRVNDTTSVCEEYTSTDDGFGNQRLEWVPRIELAGRIRSIIKARAVTENEMATGRFDADADANARGEVGIEVTWRDENGKQLHALIEGGSDILADPPEMWHRRTGTSLPATVSSLPQWPADKKWLQAIKGHRRDDIDTSSVWNSMGWVPVAGSIPVFVAGNDVVGADGHCSDALPGIGEKEISGAGRFGLNVPDAEDFDAAVRHDIEAVLDTYTGGAWLNDGVAAVALAAAMRPCVPISPHVVLLLTGARRSGKALPLDETVPMADGTVRRVVDVRLGDQVVAADGTATRVRGLSEVHDAPVRTVTLSDGRELRASSSHLWKVNLEGRVRDRRGIAIPTSLRSGLAVSMPDAVSALAGLGVHVAPGDLEHFVRLAGIPDEEVLVDGRPTQVYPYGEVLEAAADLAAGLDVPNWTTVTTDELADMVVEARLDPHVCGPDGMTRVTDVGPAGAPEPVRCLTVEHWSGCFLAGGGVPTHNSWTAEAIMSFWQKRPGNFSGSLPGTAGDTKYSIENAIAKTHIWVADDVAPSVDKRKAEATEGKIGSLIRDVHNRSATRRMSSDGTAREQLMPRALFIVTAENAQAASSEMDRVIHVTAGENFLGSRDAVDAVKTMNTQTSTTNRVVTAAIMLIARMAREKSWGQVREEWDGVVHAQNEAAASRMGGGNKVARHAGMAADLALGLVVLSQLAEQVECSDETMDRISDMFYDLFDYVRIGYEDQTSTSPGHAVVRALRSLLASGGAHVGVAGQGGPPVPSSGTRYGEHAVEISQALGWQFSADSKDAPRPGGPQIGVIAKHPKTDEFSIIFDAQTAFKEAQRAYPNLVLHGMRSAATWSSAWAEHLCTPEEVGWTRKRNGAGTVREVVRVRGVEGVPIPLSTLIVMPDVDDTPEQS